MMRRKKKQKQADSILENQYPTYYLLLNSDLQVNDI